MDPKRISVLLISSWEIPCGVATYSGFLRAGLEQQEDLELQVFPWNPSQRWQKLSAPLWETPALIEALRGKDICHIQYEFYIYYLGLPWLLGLCHRMGVKTVVTLHENARAPETPLWNSLYHEGLLPHLDRVIVHNREHWKALPASLRCRAAVVPHGVAVPPSRRRSPEAHSILLAGFWNAWKGHDLAVDALKLLEKEFPQLQLKLVGQVKDREFYQRVVAKIELCGLGEKVEIQDRFVSKEELEAHFQRATIAVLPYRRITDSGILGHLMGWGVPTVLSDLPGLRESSGGQGRYVTPGSSPALAQALAELLRDPDAQRALGDRLGEIGASRAWSPIAATTAQLYRESLERGPMGVKVLQSQRQNDEARRQLRSRGLDAVTSPWTRLRRKLKLERGARVGDLKKSWDVLQTVGFVEAHMERDAALLDLGAYGSELLPILSRLGYTRLHGMDLNPHLDAMPDAHKIHYQVGDFLNSPYEDGAFAIITAISVIEHGFSSARLFRELARLLQPGGYFLASTDYWPEKIDTSGIQAFGMPWQIFSQDELRGLLDEAQEYGLFPIGPQSYHSRDKVIHWMERSYTFAWLALQKRP